MLQALQVTTQPIPTGEGLLDAFMQVGCAGGVRYSDDDPFHEIRHCSHRRLVRKRFQGVPEERTLGIEIREEWMPSKRPAASKLPHGIRSREVVTQSNRVS
ncbi:hypothetical protein TNCV_2397071 [Trichonephila clavipes]|uniref:Uncharacterized protein n=1 Tax=Trichonephila clavipes TaxID=2585209 RepID=A0A8X6SW43_TRICX|nr:hypothetical protein TNCV_2397071 [Trichonephila clavipes]